MKALGLNLIGVDIDENGLDFDMLESKLEKYKVCLYYTIIS